MEVIVGSEIRIKDYTEQVKKFFEKKLVFDNPEYYKKLSSGRWLGDTPEKISLIKRFGNDLVIPFGMLPYIFKNKDVFTNVFNGVITSGNRIEYNSKVKPFEYQERAIEAALRGKQGIIVAPCGSGKTHIGLEIAARLGLKTLWLTHTIDLLNQSMERAKSVFDLQDEKAYGKIANGKVDVGSVITFATVQTMSNINLKELRNEFDVVIVDECHHAVGTPSKIMMFYKVVSELCARYKFGLTATPKRADGLTPCMFALIGPKVHEIMQDEVKEQTCPVKVIVNQTDFAPDMDKILLPDGTISYPLFMKEIISDEERNRMIVESIIKSKGTCIVLTDRIAHIDILREMLEERGEYPICLSGAKSTTKEGKRQRKEAIEQLKSREKRVLIATYMLAKEGLDVPNLNNLIMATPQKNEITITQSAGRVARKAEGKKFGFIYDYEDANFSMLKSWQGKRNTIYRRLGYTIYQGDYTRD